MNLRERLATLVLRTSTALVSLADWIDHETARRYFEREIEKHGHSTSIEVHDQPIRDVEVIDGETYGYPGLGNVIAQISERVHGGSEPPTDWGERNSPEAIEAHERVGKLKGIRTTAQDPEIEQAANLELEYQDRMAHLLEADNDIPHHRRRGANRNQSRKQIAQSKD